MISHFFAIFLLLPLQYSTTHIHHTHTHGAYRLSPFSSLSVRHHPSPSFILLQFPQLSRYFSLSASLPAPFLCALPPPFSLSFFLSCILYLCPAWCAVVKGGILTWHWVCSARPSTAAGGPVGSSGLRVCWLWSVVLQPICSFRIQTWNSPLKGGLRSGGGLQGWEGGLPPLLPSIQLSHSQLLFVATPSPPSPTLFSVCLNAYIKYTDSG